MTQDTSLRSWTLLASPQVKAAEIQCPPIFLPALAGVLASVKPTDVRGAAFLIVRVQSFNRNDFHRIAEPALRSYVGPRICLAINRSTLKVVASAGFAGTDFGLMLDDVDAETPLSDVACDAIEAVRFGSGFVAEASRSLRLGFALDAMLGFARDVGLCTLGTATDFAQVLDAPPARFDYVPSPTSNTPMRTLRQSTRANMRTQPAA
jgi:hypothetical protein